MIEGAEVVRVGGWGGMVLMRMGLMRMGLGGVLRNGLVALGHQLGNSLQQGAVGLNEILDGRN